MKTAAEHVRVFYAEPHQDLPISAHDDRILRLCREVFDSAIEAAESTALKISLDLKEHNIGAQEMARAIADKLRELRGGGLR